MIRKIALFMLLPLACSTTLYGQTEWTLRQCIDYAIENNISVQQNKLNSTNQEIRLNTARNSRLPSVNASVSEQGSSRGASREGVTKDNVQLNTSMNASASITVFEGMRIKHEIATRTFDFQASLQDLNRAREDVALNVAALYLQVLLNQELLKVAESQVTLSRQLVERSQILVQSGKSPESELFDSRSVLANDELNQTRAHNTLQLSLLDLTQALNLEGNEHFMIQTPDFSAISLASMSTLESPAVVYDYAVVNRPRVLAEKLRLQGSEKALLTAKSARYPSISLQGGYGNGYYYSFADQAINDPFFKQMGYNGNEYIGVSINIPIFNRLATRNNIRSAQNSIRIQELAVTETQRVLRKEIEQSYYNADAAYQQYLSAGKSLEAAREAFRYQQEKTDAGRSTIFDYNDAKMRMEKSDSQMVQAKFEFIFRRKILDFYAGHPLDFEAY